MSRLKVATNHRLPAEHCLSSLNPLGFKHRRPHVLPAVMGGATRFLILLTTPFPLRHPRPSLLRLARRSLSSPSRRLSLSHSPVPPRPSAFFAKAPQNLHTGAANNSTAAYPIRDGNFDGPAEPSSASLFPQPWPEWSKLVDGLVSRGYFNRLSVGASADDAFVAVEDLPEEFVRAASSCLAFARDKPNVLRLLSRKDVEVVVENGTPFLFKNADDTRRRLRSYLGIGENNAWESDVAQTVDLMRFLLSYASNLVISSARSKLYNRELVEPSVRNLLREVAELSYSALDSNLSASQFQDRYAPPSRPLGQNIEMKRGDWICPRCNFMNFARNVKCLECEEARPRRQLTGGEWECPQCDFFNYGRNAVCIRCDCKQPIGVSLGTTNTRSGLGYGGRSYASTDDVDSRLAANDEKAERWFNKVSQLDNSSDLNVADEDFPEIMPLRKGVNRFVVSTRKTPLERRLADTQYQRNLGKGGTPEVHDAQDANKNLDMTISQRLDEILGQTSSVSETDKKSIPGGENAERQSLSSVRSAASYPKGRNSNYVPFVPLPQDMFAKKPEGFKKGENEKVLTDKYESGALRDNGQMDPGRNEFGNSRDLLLSEKPTNQTDTKDKEKEQAEKSERWFKKVAELHDVTDLASAVSDEDFPEIMPMRKGENRFVVSKKKDRSLTSPAYKRRMAMEQGNDTNFVPFVPFPPDYFAKKDKQPTDSRESTEKPTDKIAEPVSEKVTGIPDDVNLGVLDRGPVQWRESQQTSGGNWNMGSSGGNLNEGKTGAVYGAPSGGNPTRNSINPQTNSNGNWSSGYSGKENITGTTNMTVSSPRPPENQNIRGNSIQNSIDPQTCSNGNWSSRYSGKENIAGTTNMTGSSPRPENQNFKESWTGKSLEGSAVKEPDPLDMSEEAKAERWFRRVAQIKDISELSQIPDEDFPSIMPMRKGVNRFVVSKRKTPLERRLTSAQYRRNLPIISSDPVKKENDSS